MKCETHKNFKGDFGCPVCWMNERVALKERIEELEAKIAEETKEVPFEPTGASMA